MKSLVFKLIFFFVIVGTVTSCVQVEELIYFRKDIETARPPIPNDTILNLTALRIQKYDVLSITVHTFNPELAVPFNLGGAGGNANGGGAAAAAAATYIIDENGEVDLPVLGKVSVIGLTASEAKKKVQGILKTYLKEPIVQIRFISFRISVLGEVKRPGTFSVSNDRLTIIEALGMAGDLTSYSNRNNILVVREQNGIRQFGEIDIQSTDVFKSPYYYLRQGDVVYVEPKKSKEASIRDQFSEYLPWVTSSLSAITTAIAIIRSTRG